MYDKNKQYRQMFRRKNKMTNKQKMNKKGSVSKTIEIILWFAGACLIVLFLLAWFVISKLM